MVGAVREVRIGGGDSPVANKPLDAVTALIVVECVFLRRRYQTLEEFLRTWEKVVEGCGGGNVPSKQWYPEWWHGSDFA